jgi:hypothetical protein
MSERTYQAALQIVVEKMKPGIIAAGRSAMNAEERVTASRELCRLLWHVRAEDGGFKGLDDEARDAMCARDPRLSIEFANEAMWAAGEWPEADDRAVYCPHPEIKEAAE